jgi:hypothetical protein
MSRLSTTVVLSSGLSSLPTVVDVSSRTFYIHISWLYWCRLRVRKHHLGPCWSESCPLSGEECSIFLAIFCKVLPLFCEPLTLPEDVVWGFFRCFACVDPIWHDIKSARLCARAVWPLRRRQIEVTALLFSLHLVNQGSGPLLRSNVKYCCPLTRPPGGTAGIPVWIFSLHRLFMFSGGIGIWISIPCLIYEYAWLARLLSLSL